MKIILLAVYGVAAAALAGFTALVTLVLALVLKRGGVADVR